MDTTRPGVFVGGAFQEPKDIPDTVMQASAAAARAMALLAPARGSCVRKKTYPPERDISDEPPRVGVFVCHCGSNIASVVDVERVVRETRKLPFVIHAENNVYTCADDSQDRIKQKIAEHRLNRVVIASCTPRTHEPIFRDTLRDAGLNPFLMDMANIRDQCSWVHTDNPDRATAKAIDLVRMAVGRTARLMPLAAGTRAGQQCGAGDRRRSGRHHGRLGPGRAGFSRAPGGKERGAWRHGPAASSHAGRARRSGIPGRKHPTGQRSPEDYRLSELPCRQGRRPHRTVPFDIAISPLRERGRGEGGMAAQPSP